MHEDTGICVAGTIRPKGRNTTGTKGPPRNTLPGFLRQCR